MALLTSLARGSFGEVDWLITSRNDGNFAINTTDHQTNALDNRKHLQMAIAKKVIYPVACHSDLVAEVDQDALADIEQVDGLITQNQNIALAVLSADCATVLIYAEDIKVICALHAGWRGMKDQILPKALAQLQNRGARQFKAVIGPTICGACYRVDEERYLEVRKVEPNAASANERGFAIDVRQGLLDQFDRFKISPSVIDICTFESKACFSFRRESVTGRMASVIWFNN
jgi:YfiH family protein